MEVSTSFLSNRNYVEVINELNNTNTDYVHFDVMDGKFVNNKNLSISEVKNLIDICEKKKDIHLMVKDPSKYIDALALCDIDYITIHYEIKDYLKYIDMIKEYGFKIGVAINPDTSIDKIIPILKDINLVLIMGVVPGYSGQEFIDTSIDKINNLKEYIEKNKLNVKISVDGGINDSNIDLIKNSDICVSSSFILSDYRNIDIIKNM